MANTINDLYLKYVNEVGGALEDDRYFQYLFEMIQAGTNEINQKHRVMHKVVDESWLTTIEESLDAINNIIEKPRRFVTTKEEVVPVALAKKITADSVRHLSMNTQFIASNENGDIHPTRVLNITTEESYDLYENRFIYHLIQRLVTFIDKRTDVIFWSTGDETKNTLSFHSKVDDAYEEIEYKIEMTVKNHQSFAENDNDNMQVFMRIDRVRRMVMSLRNSAFCSLMAGCAKVRSPIQRTNLMMKDPNYRTCYKLWQFLERYDEVGYTIVVQDEALEFDEEYMIQLYINLITNYTVFKSLLETDNRNLEEVLATRRKIKKPKFIKKIEEKIVDDYNIDDVEIRKVFVEEVTQAQLDAEAKLAQESELRQQLEQDLEELDSQLMVVQQQLMSVMDLQEQAEARADEEQLAREAETAAKEAEIEARKKETVAKEEALKQAAAEAQARVAAQETLHKLEEELLALRTSQKKAEESAKKAEEECARIQQCMQELKEQTNVQIQEEKENARLKVETAREEARTKVKAAEEAARHKVETIEKEARVQVETAQKTAAAQVKETRDAAATQIKEVQETAAAQIKQAQETAAAQIKEAQETAAAQIKEVQDAAAAQVEEAGNTARVQVETAQKERDAALAARQTAEELLRKETKARERAQAKANANSLSKYIISVLNERRQKNESAQAEETILTEEKKESDQDES